MFNNPQLLKLETPCLVIDEAIVRKNIKDMQQRFDALGIALRPHIKTHKNYELTKMQLDAGAQGITCQRLGEAEELLARGPIPDILITYNIIGAAKLARLLALSNKTKISVTADSEDVLMGLSNCFSNAGEVLDVLIECDTGGKRCGVQSPKDAIALAAVTSKLPGLRFKGLMTYPAKKMTKDTETYFTKALALARDAGITINTISSGGTPGARMTKSGVINEYRAGTYIFNDRSLVVDNQVAWDDCASRVLSTVISRPTANRAVIDAGSKTLTSDMPHLGGYGHIIGHDDSSIDTLSEEHGVVSLASQMDLQVGDLVQIVPNHTCVVTNMFNSAWLLSELGDVKSIKIHARN